MTAAQERIAQNFRASIKPRDRRLTREWARDMVTLVEPLTKTGPFDSTISRHLEGPLDALDDDHCREVNVLAPVRSGKTLIADVWLCSIIGRTPGATRWVFQDDTAAKDQAELRTWKIIEANGWLNAMLPEDRHKARAQQIIFPGMPLHISGPSLAQLQSRGYQNIIADEAWLYKPGRMEELRSRLGDYVKMGTDKLLVLSQGGELGSDWDEQCRRGIQHEWEFQCMSCGRYMRPERWTLKRDDGSRWGMVWDKHKTDGGLWDIPKVLPSIRFECQHCGHPHLDGVRTKSEWNRTGRFAVEETDKSRKRRTFHWTSVIDFPWETLVELYLQAVNEWRTGNPLTLIQFFQKRTAEMKSENSLIEELSFQNTKKYEINSEWSEEVDRALTIDRQDQDVFYWTARMWAANGRSRRLDRGRATGFPELEAIREQFKIRPTATLIDSGFKPKGDNGVYGACIKYGWIPVKGAALTNGEPKHWRHADGILRTYSEPIKCDPEIGKQGQEQSYVLRVDFSSPTYADRLQHLIDLDLWEEPDLPAGDVMEIEYRRQMASEFKKRFTYGPLKQEKHLWVCPSKNNHYRDCGKMQTFWGSTQELLPNDLPDELTNEAA